MLAGTPQLAPWCWYLARDGERPVGAGGFKGSADADGIAEIAYLTFVAARGRGVARAVVASLLDVASDAGAGLVRAHTLPEANASTAVLIANGFTHVGLVDDPEDGPVRRWQRSP